MSNEIKVIARTGLTIEVDVFKPDGTERSFGVSVTETGQGRLYLGDLATILPGDIQIAYDTGTSRMVAAAEYKPSAAAGGSSSVVPAGYLGNYKDENTVYFFWSVAAAPSVAGTVKVYRNDGSGEVTAPTGITDTRNFDSKTGVNLCRIDLSATSFYVGENDYIVVLSGATINGITVNAVIASFSVKYRHVGMEYLKN